MASGRGGAKALRRDSPSLSLPIAFLSLLMNVPLPFLIATLTVRMPVLALLPASPVMAPAPRLTLPAKITMGKRLGQPFRPLEGKLLTQIKAVLFVPVPVVLADLMAYVYMSRAPPQMSFSFTVFYIT